jgi:hypothetical protein
VWLASNPERQRTDVLDLAGPIERPFSARITVDGRAVIAFVLKYALRRGRAFEHDLEPFLLAVRRLLLSHHCSFVRLAPSGPHHLRHRGRTRLAASMLALLMPHQMVPADRVTDPPIHI